MAVSASEHATTWTEDVEQVVAAAASAADAVDREARPPVESLAALRETGMLSAAIPRELGGLGWDLPRMAAAVSRLATACSSTGLLWAMQQSQLLAIVRHTRTRAWRNRCRVIAEQGLLVASASSEAATGGDFGSTATVLEPAGNRSWRVVKHASTVSYGEIADAYLLSCRRVREGEPREAVLVYAERSACRVEVTTSWNVLGMRGTASPSLEIDAVVATDAVLTDDFDVVMRQTMVPVAHVLWSAAWIGMATVAVDRARAALANASAQSPSKRRTLVDIVAMLDTARALLNDALPEAEGGGIDSPRESVFPASSIRFNQLKMQVSTLATSAVIGALGVAGVAGYTLDPKSTITRQVRDVLAASLMVNNHRLADINGELELLRGRRT